MYKQKIYLIKDNPSVMITLLKRSHAHTNKLYTNDRKIFNVHSKRRRRNNMFQQNIGYAWHCCLVVTLLFV